MTTAPDPCGAADRVEKWLEQWRPDRHQTYSLASADLQVLIAAARATDPAVGGDLAALRLGDTVDIRVGSTRLRGTVKTLGNSQPPLIIGADAAGADSADLLMQAWGVIANVSQGRWETEPPEWQDAATRWRDAWHASMGIDPGGPPPHRLAAGAAPEAATEGGVQNEHGDVDLIDEAWSLLTSEDRDDAWEAARDRWGVRYGQNEPPRGGPDRARLLEEMWRRRVATPPRAEGEAAAGELLDDPGPSDLGTRMAHDARNLRIVRNKLAPDNLVDRVALDSAIKALERHDCTRLGEGHDHLSPTLTRVSTMLRLEAPTSDEIVGAVADLVAHRCAPPAPEVVSAGEAGLAVGTQLVDLTEARRKLAEIGQMLDQLAAAKLTRRGP